MCRLARDRARKKIMTNSRRRPGPHVVAQRLSARRAAVRRLVVSGTSDKRAQTQERLLQAGRDLFIDQGIGATSVGDICSRAGFTRGAFYSNFTDMEHFVCAVAEREWGHMVTDVRDAVSYTLPTSAAQVPRTDADVHRATAQLVDRLRHVMPVSRAYYVLHNEFIGYILRGGDHAQVVKRGYEDFIACLCEVLATGLEAIGRRTILSVQDTMELLMTAAEGSMRAALIEGDGQELTAQFERSLPVLLMQLTRPIEQE